MIITYSYDNRKICFGCKYYSYVEKDPLIGLCQNQVTRANKARFATSKKCKQWEERDIDKEDGE